MSPGHGWGRAVLRTVAQKTFPTLFLTFEIPTTFLYLSFSPFMYLYRYV